MRSDASRERACPFLRFGCLAATGQREGSGTLFNNLLEIKHIPCVACQKTGNEFSHHWIFSGEGRVHRKGAPIIYLMYKLLNLKRPPSCGKFAELRGGSNAKWRLKDKMKLTEKVISELQKEYIHIKEERRI